MSSNTGELVMIPTPGISHLQPTLQLSKLILQTTQNISISIYVIYFPHQATKVNGFLDSQSLDNPYPTRLTFVPFSIQTTLPDPTPLSFVTAMEANKSIVKQAVEDRVRAGLGKPVGFVLDIFCAGFVDVANELNIPSYIFSTTGVSFLNIMFYAQSMVDDHGVDVAKEFNDPGFSGLVSGFKNPVTSDVIPKAFLANGPLLDMLLNLTRKIRETKGILVNTYMELQSFGIGTLVNSVVKKMPIIYPVGPILKLDDKIGGGSDNEEKKSIMEWLDGQPKSSVVFLCFGSMGCFDAEQVKEIANGLERSGHRFLWALRKPPPSNNEIYLEALPKGFVDRTSDRGKIIGFAPQVAVLAHPAIGGFVSHCGWNSTLESLWFGVPMGTWPMFAEQQLNAFELVKELELAVEIRLDYKFDNKVRKGNFLISAEEVEKALNNLMNIDEKMTGRVKNISDEAKQALDENGSSNKSLRHFIQDVLNSSL
ncbi:anthocyanidin 3-O-glucosyltransferase 2-like [Silene latifolia]|uniref:anthocyanidin 3-O-glucosyltransferase 2-like n=1 Tax=Silene latifolia TaxID=37657 RepID=UPI003D77B883